MSHDAVVVLCRCSGCFVPTKSDKACSSQKSSELAVLKIDVVAVLFWFSGCVVPIRLFFPEVSEIALLNLDAVVVLC